MISILIPVYNWDIALLVHSLRTAMENTPEYHELIIGDDGSSAEFKSRYEILSGGPVKVYTSGKNIGRAAIRNRLACEASGDYFLFIDADAMIPETAGLYLRAWLPYIGKAEVLCGGTQYPDFPPADPAKTLRWRYGRSREQQKASERNKHPNASFSGFNFLTARDTFMKIRFNEELIQYGHEDTLLGYQLVKAGCRILHIDNALIHEGVELNNEFIAKTKQGIENLSILYDKVTDRKAFAASVRLARNYNRIAAFGLAGLLTAIYIRYRERMEIHLISDKSSLFVFALFKLCLFATFRAIHGRRKILPIL